MLIASTRCKERFLIKYLKSMKYSPLKARFSCMMEVELFIKFFSVSGGIGKSHLIKTIYHCLTKH